MKPSAHTTSFFSARARRWLLLFHLPLLVLGAFAAYGYWYHATALDHRIEVLQRTVAYVGRMRVHTETMQTALLLSERSLANGAAMEDPLYRLQIASDRFNSIINAFNEGGEVVEPDLLVVDAREMSTPLLHRALRQAAEWRASGNFRHGLLIWPEPSVEGVVLAIRAGFDDVVPAGVGPLTLARILVRSVAPGAMRHVRLRRLWGLLRLGRPASVPIARIPERELAVRLAAEQQAHFGDQLAAREAALAQREQELRRMAERVQIDLSRANQACAMIELASAMRAELEKRENELRLMAREMPPPVTETVEIEETLVRMEMEGLLRTQRDSLDRRERALATRERWLRDYEQALTGRTADTRVN